MHMVFDAADLVKRFPAKWMPVRRRKRDKTKTLENAIFRPDDAAEVGIEPLRNRSRNPGCASLRRGDDMKKKLRICARHRNSFAPPGLRLEDLDPRVPLRSTRGYSPWPLRGRDEAM